MKRKYNKKTITTKDGTKVDSAMEEIVYEMLKEMSGFVAKRSKRIEVVKPIGYIDKPIHVVPDFVICRDDSPHPSNKIRAFIEVKSKLYYDRKKKEFISITETDLWKIKWALLQHSYVNQDVLFFVVHDQNETIAAMHAIKEHFKKNQE